MARKRHEFHLRLDDETLNMLTWLSAHLSLTLSAVIRKLIREAYERYHG